MRAFKNIPYQTNTYCDRTDCFERPARKVKSGAYNYKLCKQHAREMTVFERSFKTLREEMAAYYGDREKERREKQDSGMSRRREDVTTIVQIGKKRRAWH